MVSDKNPPAQPAAGRSGTLFWPTPAHIERAYRKADRVRAHLEYWRNALVDQDRDYIHLVSGLERVGKSTYARSLCRYLDPSFDEGRIAWKAADAVAIALRTPPGGALMLDEGVVGLLNRDAMTKENKQFMKFLIVCGERNLALVICFPRIWNVDPYLREHRAHAWTHLVGRSADGRGNGIMHEAARPVYEPGVYWRKLGKVTWSKETGADWQRYTEKKHACVKGIGSGVK